MDFDKPAITLDEQIALLRARGMRIDDPDRARHYLQHINYYRLTAYWLPFEADHGTHQLRPGTRFEDALNLYVFDRELRLHPLNAIERIEVSLGTHWAYYMAHTYGPHAYIDPAHARRRDWHAKNLASLESASDRNHEAAQHQTARIWRKLRRGRPPTYLQHSRHARVPPRYCKSRSWMDRALAPADREARHQSRANGLPIRFPDAAHLAGCMA